MNAIPDLNAFDEAAVGMTPATGTIPVANQQDVCRPGILQLVQADAQLQDWEIFCASFTYLTPNLERVTYPENLLKPSP